MMNDDIIMRTIIDLPESQVVALREFCERQKISRAEAIRRAVDGFLQSSAKANRDEAFGVWKSRGDSRKEVDALRGEWDKRSSSL